MELEFVIYESAFFELFGKFLVLFSLLWTISYIFKFGR